MRRALLALIYILTVPGGPLWAAVSDGTRQPAGRAIQGIERPTGPVRTNDLGVDENVTLDVTPDVRLPILEQDLAGQAAKGAPSRSLSPEDAGGGASARKNAPPRPATQDLIQAGQGAAKAAKDPAGSDSRDEIDFTEPLSRRSALGDADPAVVAPIASADRAPSLARPGGDAAVAADVPSPSVSLHNSKGAWSFIVGTFGAQLANRTLQVTLPLLLFQVTHSWSTVAWVLGGSTFLDMVGTKLGGLLADRYSPKAALAFSAWVRVAAAASLPILLSLHALSLPALLAVIVVDAVSRGIGDTARTTLSGQLTGGEKGPLDTMLSRFQTAFDLGGIAGPFLTAWLMGGFGAPMVQWIAPVGFIATALLYLGIPRKSAMPTPVAARRDRAAGAAQESTGPRRWMLWALLATALLSLYPLQGILPGMFAQNVLGDISSTGWLVGFFGVGSLIGDLVYARLPASWRSPSRWIALGAGGTLAMAAGWLTGAFWPAAIAILAFSATNSLARLSLNSDIQSRVAGATAGSALGWVRLIANGTSATLRVSVGLAFLAFTGSTAWIAISAGIGLFAAAQWGTARVLASAKPIAWKSVIRTLAWPIVIGGAGLFAYFHGTTESLSAPLMMVSVLGVGVPAPTAAPRASPVHGMPGRLIVVEGLDGSGKSTQLEMLKELLESKGLKVVVTQWNSSDLLSETVKRAKKERALTPKTFAYFNAADLDVRMEKTILPALREGAIVLSDRHFFTALARDAVRGNDAHWLRNLYSSTIRPDLTLRFKLPVKTAIQRVLSRVESRLKLSEDFDDDHDRVLGQNFYAVGRDMNFSPDDRKNFTMFQEKVDQSYDVQSEEYGFVTIDATKTREVQHRLVGDAALSMLGPLDGYQKAVPRAPSIFDKNPADDSEKIRANYLHEKHGAHFYFRNMFEKMQDRFEELMDHRIMPKVFGHNNFHLANYQKTAQGASIGDWDRARYGVYAWDIVRDLVSLSLYAKRPLDDKLLDPKVVKQFVKGYLHGFKHPDRAISEARVLKDVEPKPHEVSTNEMLKSGKKWVAEMREDPLPADDPSVVALVQDYLDRRGEAGMLKEFDIEEAGRGEGSMGMRDIYLVVLAPKDPDSTKDRIFLNFKSVRKDADRRWSKSPFESECQRMLAAGNLYAPGWEERPGCARLDGVEYFVRQLPPQNVKIKGKLDKDEQKDVAYALGTQMGRGHRLSLEDANRVFHQNFSPEDLEKHLNDNLEKIVEAGFTIKQEILDAHQRYVSRMRREGLLPGKAPEE